MRKLSVVASSLFLIPGFAVGQATTAYAPMTHAERFHRYVTGTFSAEAVLRSAAGAGILQGTNTPGEWGQGAAGYARRFGNSYAQHIMRQTLMYGASDLLHEDNRYRLSEESGAGPRLKYALVSTFMARKDDGTRRLSYSRIGSVVAVAFLSREWQPHSTNGAQNAEYNVATTFGAEAGFNVAREFLPKLFHVH